LLPNASKMGKQGTGAAELAKPGKLQAGLEAAQLCSTILSALSVPDILKDKLKEKHLHTRQLILSRYCEKMMLRNENSIYSYLRFFS
jgi:hypothetical protein